jgi:tetratricopeptide (TPR) repeat protein
MSDWTRKLARGAELSSAEVVALETFLSCHSHDITARAQLMGYYRRQHTASDQTRFHYHLFQMIEFHPDIDTSPANMIVRDDFPAEYAQGLALWGQATQLRRVAVFQNAARYAERYDRELACDWLRECTALEPTDSRLYTDLARALRGVGRHQQAHAIYDVAYEFASSTEQRRNVTIAETRCTLAIARFDCIPNLLSRISELACEEPTWSIGLYYANILRGIGALKVGDLRAATAGLKHAGSLIVNMPLIAAYGTAMDFPDTTLAGLLVERGQFDDVRGYIECCQRFLNDAQFERWQAALAAGHSPWTKPAQH